MTRRPALELCRETRGAVLVEHSLVLIPILLLALASWQAVEVWSGDLILRRAAGAAARAAIVVLADDPAFYAGVPVHEFSGARKLEIELAAALVLAHFPQFVARPRVELLLAGERRAVSEHAPLTLSVSAPFRCRSAFLPLLCAGARQLRASATLPYQGASYRY